jgi:hypothetical protein
MCVLNHLYYNHLLNPHIYYTHLLNPPIHLHIHTYIHIHTHTADLAAVWQAVPELQGVLPQMSRGYREEGALFITLGKLVGLIGSCSIE